jgi:D-alanyl-D-alanine dipeptidase
MNEPDDLVYIDEHGLIGSNFYWHKYESKGLTREDVTSAGLTNDRVQLSAELIEPLKSVERELASHGFRLFIKEGYRSRALYEMVYRKRVEKFGKEETDRLLNMQDMPHALGRSVDAALWSLADNTEVYLRNKVDGVDAMFINFYQNKPDPQSREYQRLQDLLINIMLKYGFRLGTKKEYFHFDYRLETLPNYQL